MLSQLLTGDANLTIIRSAEEKKRTSKREGEDFLSSANKAIATPPRAKKGNCSRKGTTKEEKERYMKGKAKKKGKKAGAGGERLVLSATYSPTATLSYIYEKKLGWRQRASLRCHRAAEKREKEGEFFKHRGGGNAERGKMSTRPVTKETRRSRTKSP